jgi:hypothetical protein
LDKFQVLSSSKLINHNIDFIFLPFFLFPIKRSTEYVQYSNETCFQYVEPTESAAVRRMINRRDRGFISSGLLR